MGSGLAQNASQGVLALACCLLALPAWSDEPPGPAKPGTAQPNVHVLPQFGKGEGEQYTAFIVEVLKPWIDQHYRTRPERRHTAIMGSSMGGLISSYAISHYPQVFGKAAIFSPAYWLAPQVFADTEARPPPPAQRIYFYAGGSEDLSMVPDMERMVALLRRQGLPATNLAVRVNPVGRHNESAWRVEFPRALEWLFRDQLVRSPHRQSP